MRIFRNATPYLYILTPLLIPIFFSTSPGRAGEGLSVQSIAISEIEDGREKRWKRPDEVWTLLHDGGRAFECIREEILDYLNRNP